MLLIEQITQAFRGGKYTAPKTVLGFLIGICVILSSVLLGITIVIADSDVLRWLVIPIVIFIAGGAVALVRTVLRLAEKDPTPLVLGEISGGDFTAHQRLLVGDSTSGERLVSEHLLYTDQPPEAKDSPDERDELPEDTDL